LAAGDQVGEAGGQRGGLAGARAGEDEDGPFGGQHSLALRGVQSLQIGRIVGEGGGFGHACEVSGGERNGNRSAADSANRRRFLQLCPISPLSTGSTPHFSLSRLGWQVHGAWVIGTAVPASPRVGNGTRARQVTKGPISAGRIGRNLRVLTGPAGKRRRKSLLPQARRGSWWSS